MQHVIYTATRRPVCFYHVIICRIYGVGCVYVSTVLSMHVEFIDNEIFGAIVMYLMYVFSIIFKKIMSTGSPCRRCAVDFG